MNFAKFLTPILTEHLWWQPLFYQPKKSKKKSGIPELVKAIGNVTAADASAVNAELEIFSKKIRKKGHLIQY